LSPTVTFSLWKIGSLWQKCDRTLPWEEACLLRGGFRIFGRGFAF